MDDKMSQPEMVVVFLSKYRGVNLNSRFTIPYEMTQSGIGECLGISRSHVSMILGKLERNGIVKGCKATVRYAPSGSCSRRVYVLTEAGERMCKEILDRKGVSEAEAADALIPSNINFCKTESFDALPPEDRDILGALMVINEPVPMEALPLGRRHPLVPIDVKGFVAIRPEVRRRYLGRAKALEIARWHALAADICAAMGGNPVERLCHLYRGNRRKEALKLAQCDPYTMVDRCTRESARILEALDAETDDSPLAWAAALCSIRTGELDCAWRAVRRAKEEDRRWLECELLLAEGDRSGALEKALDGYDSTTHSAIALGKCMASNCRHSEAVVFLRKARRCMTESGCLFRLDEELIWEADCYLALGEREAASKLMESAACAVRDDRAGRLLLRKARVLASEDLAGLQGVHV